MPGGSGAALLDALGLRERRYVHLIGGGGKTTLMFAAARALADEGRSVLTTTTTRILWPEAAQSERVVLGVGAAELIARVRGELATCRNVTVASPSPEGGRKLGGLALDVLDALAEARVADHVVVEADGSAGRPLKAHAEHEPVVSPRADLVIAVVGVDCLGAPLDDAHVHRAALVCARLGRPAGSIVTAVDVANIVLHREGWLARVARDCEVVVLVNKAETSAARAAALGLARALRTAAADRRLRRVVVGDVRTGAFESA